MVAASTLERCSHSSLSGGRPSRERMTGLKVRLGLRRRRGLGRFSAGNGPWLSLGEEAASEGEPPPVYERPPEFGGDEEECDPQRHPQPEVLHEVIGDLPQRDA